jgi:predicted nucleic acid-binding protein
VIPAVPDTSFLCALYHLQANHERAIAYMSAASAPLPVSEFLGYEFTNGVRFEVFRHRCDHTRGYPESEALRMLADFDLDLERGVFMPVEVDSADVLRRAMSLSEKHTIRSGRRSFDILHVATALSLGAREFLTFDAGQRTLAEAEGLVVPF